MNEGLIDNVVYAIDVDNFSVWVGTRKGASRYDKVTKIWTGYTEENSGLINNHVTQVKISGDKIWFVGNEGGVCYYESLSDTWTDFTQTAGHKVNALCFDGDIIWFAMDDGAGSYNIPLMEWTHYTSNSGLIENSVLCIGIDQSSVWFGTGHGISRFDKRSQVWTSWSDFGTGLSSNHVVAMDIEQYHGWFAVKGDGIVRLDKMTDSWNVFNKENSGLVENNVQSMAVDVNFVWFGTGKRGVSRYEKNNNVWTVLNTERGLINDNVFTISVEDSFVWFGTQEGLCRFDKLTDQLQSYTVLNSGLSDNVILCSHMDGKTLWLGTENGGACRFHRQNQTWEVFDTFTSGIADNLVQCIDIDDEYVWIGTRENGLSRYTKATDQWKNFTVSLSPIAMESELPSNDIRSIYVDGDYVWVGYLHAASFINEAVLSRYQKSTSKWQHFTNELFGSWLAGNNVQSIGIDEDYVWMGFFEPWSGAINRFSKATGSMDIFTYDDGLADRNIWAIGTDKRFNWFGTGSGVNRFDKKDEYFLIFNTSDGVSADWIRSIGIDKDCVWFGTIGGGVSKYKDEMAPLIIHQSTLSKQPLSEPISISAKIEENILVTGACLYYKKYDAVEYDSVSMSPQISDYWAAEIPVTHVTMSGVHYYIRSTDGYNDSFHPWDFPYSPPHQIEIYDDIPPAAEIAISPEEDKEYVFQGDRITINGFIDGTGTAPRINGILLNEYTSLGSRLASTPLSTELLNSGIQGNVITINDSMMINLAHSATSAIDFTFLVTESDSLEAAEFTTNRVLVIQDDEFPICFITEPGSREEVGTMVRIKGTVYDDHLQKYQLHYGIGESPREWSEILIKNAFKNVLNDYLADWYTIELADTVYTLRLRAFDLAGQMSEDKRMVYVKKESVPTRQGGSFLSPDSLATLYIPPNAVDDYIPISINKTIVIPHADDLSASPVNVSYQIEPEAVVLKKSGILNIQYASSEMPVNLNEKRYSVYYWQAGEEQWIRLGGSVDTLRNTISVAMNLFGLYSIMEDDPGSASGESLRYLDIQPRIFSPKGGGHSLTTAVLFDLGKNSLVTIKIYNAAARLVNILADHISMRQGNNVIYWDGRDQWNTYCQSGLYIVSVQTGHVIKNKTVVILYK